MSQLAWSFFLLLLSLSLFFCAQCCSLSASSLPPWTFLNSPGLCFTAVSLLFWLSLFILPSSSFFRPYTGMSVTQIKVLLLLYLNTTVSLTKPCSWNSGLVGCDLLISILLRIEIVMHIKTTLKMYEKRSEYLAVTSICFPGLRKVTPEDCQV